LIIDDSYQGIASAMPQSGTKRKRLQPLGFGHTSAAKAEDNVHFVGTPEGMP
jgi:hypothetical protein